MTRRPSRALVDGQHGWPCALPVTPDAAASKHCAVHASSVIPSGWVRLVAGASTMRLRCSSPERLCHGATVRTRQTASLASKTTHKKKCPYLRDRPPHGCSCCAAVSGIRTGLPSSRDELAHGLFSDTAAVAAATARGATGDRRWRRHHHRYCSGRCGGRRRPRLRHNRANRGDEKAAIGDGGRPKHPTVRDRGGGRPRYPCRQVRGGGSGGRPQQSTPRRAHALHGLLEGERRWG